MKHFSREDDVTGTPHSAARDFCIEVHHRCRRLMVDMRTCWSSVHLPHCLLLQLTSALLGVRSFISWAGVSPRLISAASCLRRTFECLTCPWFSLLRRINWHATCRTEPRNTIIPDFLSSYLYIWYNLDWMINSFIRCYLLDSFFLFFRLFHSMDALFPFSPQQVTVIFLKTCHGTNKRWLWRWW